MTDNRTTKFVDEPDIIRNEFMDDGLLMVDNQMIEKLIKEFVAIACECEVRDCLIAEYAERIEQAIADELNAERDKWKAKVEEAGRAMNAAVGLWAKADAENRELHKMLMLDDGTVEEYAERADPLTALAYQKQLAEEWRDRCHNAEALCDRLNAKLESGGTCKFIPYKDKGGFGCCSVCNESMFAKDNFCPRCGAKVVK